MLYTKWHLRFGKVERQLLKFHSKKKKRKDNTKGSWHSYSLIHCTICWSGSAAILLICYCPNIKSNFKTLKFISYSHCIKSGLEICKFIKLNEHIFHCQTIGMSKWLLKPSHHRCTSIPDISQTKFSKPSHTTLSQQNTQPHTWFHEQRFAQRGIITETKNALNLRKFPEHQKFNNSFLNQIYPYIVHPDWSHPTWTQRKLSQHDLLRFYYGPEWTEFKVKTSIIPKKINWNRHNSQIDTQPKLKRKWHYPTNQI